MRSKHKKDDYQRCEKPKEKSGLAFRFHDVRIIKTSLENFPSSFSFFFIDLSFEFSFEFLLFKQRQAVIDLFRGIPAMARRLFRILEHSF